MKKSIVLVLLLAVMMTCCCAYAKEDNRMPVMKAPASISALAEPASKNEVIIGEIVNLKDRYTDGAGNTSSYSYRIPKVKEPATDYTQFVNQDIDRVYDLYIESQLQSIAEGYSLYVYDVDYAVNSYNGITSLVITVEADADCTYYFIYNFKYDGTKANNEDVFKAAGITGDLFVSKAREIVSNHISPYASMQDLYNRTMSGENINVNMPVAISNTGKILFEASIYTPAGAGRYSSLFELE